MVNYYNLQSNPKLQNTEALDIIFVPKLTLDVEIHDHNAVTVISET